MKKRDKETIVAEIELQTLEQDGFAKDETEDDGDFDSRRSEDEEEILEIQLDDEDFEKHSESRVSEDDAPNSKEKKSKKKKGLKKKRTKRERIVPSETVLQERSIISFVLGLLSCSVFMGNPIFALVGIGVGLSTKKYKHKSIYSTIGIFASLCGLVLSLIPILAFAFVVLVIVALGLFVIALGLLEILLLLVAVVLILVINPMTELLVNFFMNMLLPITMCAGLLL